MMNPESSSAFGGFLFARTYLLSFVALFRSADGRRGVVSMFNIAPTELLSLFISFTITIELLQS